MIGKLNEENKLKGKDVTKMRQKISTLPEEQDVDTKNQEMQEVLFTSKIKEDDITDTLGLHSYDL